MMKRFISSVFVLGVCLTPLTVPLMVQPSWGQSQDLQVEEIKRLIQKARQQERQGQPRQAIETLQELLAIARQLKDKKLESFALNTIGIKYYNIGNYNESLNYYNQSLAIKIKIGDRSGEASTLNNLGAVYNRIGQPQKALEYFKQALSVKLEESEIDGYPAILNNIGEIYNSIGQPEEALKYLEPALQISREIKDIYGEGVILNNIGEVYNSIEQNEKALDYYSQALPIRRQVSDFLGEATTLNSIGAVYRDRGQLQEAITYYSQALQIQRQVSDSFGEAATIHNLCTVYGDIDLPKEALDCYQQALLILKEIGNYSDITATLNGIGGAYLAIGEPQQALDYFHQALSITRKESYSYLSEEAATLGNIAYVYQVTNRPDEAIRYWEQSVEITLQMRGRLAQDNRQQTRQRFLQSCGCRGNAIPLTSLLIDQNQADRAFQWINIATTADLADYTRLINAKVANPQAQKAIDEWNQKNQQLQFLRRQLQDKFSENLSRQMRELDTEVNRKAEEISRQFPEVAELFETTPKDIAQLKASIAPDTVVIQPVLLTNVKNVPNTVALFVKTKDSLSVKKIAIDPAEFDKLLTEHREEISNYLTSDYRKTGGKLYDILIRPIEDQIQALSPKQLSIIATGKLRYIPFETLWDTKNRKFLIQKYPVNYLTRISTRSIPNSTLQGGILALGNPITRAPQNLPGSEAEVRNIAQLLPGSSAYIGNAATLD